MVEKTIEKVEFKNFNEEMEHITKLRENYKITIHEELDMILEAHRRWSNGHNGGSHVCLSCDG
jgi:hypothetical protein